MDVPGCGRCGCCVGQVEKWSIRLDQRDEMCRKDHVGSGKMDSVVENLYNSPHALGALAGGAAGIVEGSAGLLSPRNLQSICTAEVSHGCISH